jgi:hypothetical protein
MLCRDAEGQGLVLENGNIPPLSKLPYPDDLGPPTVMHDCSCWSACWDASPRRPIFSSPSSSSASFHRRWFQYVDARLASGVSECFSPIISYLATIRLSLVSTRSPIHEGIRRSCSIWKRQNSTTYSGLGRSKPSSERYVETCTIYTH